MPDWNETIQKLNAERKPDDPKPFINPPMPQGVPIEEIPIDWKDGRKVLVYGEYRMDSDGYEITDFPKWYSAKFDPVENIWLPLDPGAKSRYWISATHFLPYPADPV